MFVHVRHTHTPTFFFPPLVASQLSLLSNATHTQKRTLYRYNLLCFAPQKLMPDRPSKKLGAFTKTVIGANFFS